uniref:AlNc14C80G5276 protein n=1 Tax=Albugo laibachii Nc14 TaxID=890382 RepID=F0WF84_9STRA|nr:AlNc14C80G5276 [Albugo laibachii Nc14]|eukprot:CCA19866.1 AlNc14C80G5276 [Albugo laibachii Nc14]
MTDGLVSRASWQLSNKPVWYSFRRGYGTLILTDKVGKVQLCTACKKIKVLDPSVCRQFLDHHAMEAEKYTKPLVLQSKCKFDGSCLVLYHTKSTRLRWVDCMTKVFHGETLKAHLTTRYSALLDVSKLDMNLNPRIFGKLLECHDYRNCFRIQKVPIHFCSYHEALISNPAWIQGVKFKTFTKDGIPVGVWPPQTHSVILKQDDMMSKRVSATNSESTDDSNIWPSSGNIAWVRLETAHSEHFDCVNCLIQYTEVFFVYKDEYT